MDENYIAYIDIGKRGIQSLLLASFDSEKLSDDDQNTLSDCFNNNDCQGWMDSLMPEYVYIGLDVSGDKPIIMVDQSYDDEEPWSVDVIDVYPTYEYAIKAFLREAKFKGKDYKKAVMKLIWGKNV